MEVGEHPVVLLPHHTVEEVLGLTDARPPAPDPAPGPAPDSAPESALTFAPAPASGSSPTFIPVPTFTPNPSPIHDFTSGPHLAFANTLPGNGLKQPDKNDGLTNSNLKKSAIQERQPKKVKAKTFSNNFFGAHQKTPLLRKSLALKVSTEV